MTSVMKIFFHSLPYLVFTSALQSIILRMLLRILPRFWIAGISTKINEPIKLRLRYWNVRGRAQAVRYMLEEITHDHPNVDYQEHVEYLDKATEVWSQRKSDDIIAGPFHNLPVLYWNDKQIFGQTLTIGSNSY